MSCGRVKSANDLYKQAKRSYGECTIVSKTETKKKTKKKTEVVLHDTLQDFDYKIISSMEKINIDGSNFGSVPNTSDTFMRSLKEKILSNVKDQLDNICGKGGMYYEGDFTYDSDILLIIYANNVTEGEEAAVQCAEILQEQNKNHRLDKQMIYVVSNESDRWYHNEHLGSVKLPDISWRTPEDEDIEFYTEKAHAQTDKDAKFLYIKSGQFADTGVDLQRVVIALGTDYPTTMDSAVTFYYFESSDGEVYYLCDFNYYDEDYSEFAWYTNYRGGSD